MLAVNPALTPYDFDLLLAGAHPGTSLRITRDIGAAGRDDLYGQGLIDAAQAVAAARQVADASGSAPPKPVLSVAPAILDFRNYLEVLSLTISNGGGGTLEAVDIAVDRPWLSVTPASGAPPLTVKVAVDRAGLADGSYEGAITVSFDGGDPVAVPVRCAAGGETLGNVGAVHVLAVDADTFQTVADTMTTLAESYAYRFPQLPDGRYFLYASTDRDGDGDTCEQEDACGSHADPIEVQRGQALENVRIVVGELLSP
jgi:serine protease